MIRKRAVVSGVVQGVGFRYHTQTTAVRLGVTGWVRNLQDGSVEAEIEGDDPAVTRMLEWLQTGPAWARVHSVDVADIAPRGDTDFVIGQ